MTMLIDLLGESYDLMGDFKKILLVVRKESKQDTM